jgi:hypothetical protein
MAYPVSGVDPKRTNATLHQIPSLYCSTSDALLVIFAFRISQECLPYKLICNSDNLNPESDPPFLELMDENNPLQLLGRLRPEENKL